MCEHMVEQEILSQDTRATLKKREALSRRGPEGAVRHTRLTSRAALSKRAAKADASKAAAPKEVTESAAGGHGSDVGVFYQKHR